MVANPPLNETEQSVKLVKANKILDSLKKQFNIFRNDNIKSIKIYETANLVCIKVDSHLFSRQVKAINFICKKFKTEFFINSSVEKDCFDINIKVEL